MNFDLKHQGIKKNCKNKDIRDHLKKSIVFYQKHVNKFTL